MYPHSNDTAQWQSSQSRLPPGCCLRESYDRSVAVAVVTIARAPAPAAKHGLISQEVISQEVIAEMTTAKKMANARSSFTASAAATAAASHGAELIPSATTAVNVMSVLFSIAFAP